MFFTLLGILWVVCAIVGIPDNAKDTLRFEILASSVYIVGGAIMFKLSDIEKKLK